MMPLKARYVCLSLVALLFATASTAAAERLYVGKVVQASDTKLTILEQEDAQPKSFTVDAEVPVTLNGKRVQLEELTRGDFATVKVVVLNGSEKVEQVIAKAGKRK